MTKRTEKARGTQAGNEGAGTLGDVLTPLIAGMTVTRAHLHDCKPAQQARIVPVELAIQAHSVELRHPKGRIPTVRAVDGLAPGALGSMPELLLSRLQA